MKEKTEKTEILCIKRYMNKVKRQVTNEKMSAAHLKGRYVGYIKGSQKSIRKA